MASLYPYGKRTLADVLRDNGVYIRLRGTASTEVGGVPGSRVWSSSEYDGQPGLDGIISMDFDIATDGSMSLASSLSPREFDISFVDYSGAGATITAITIEKVSLFGATSSLPDYLNKTYLEASFASPITYNGAGKFTLTDFNIGFTL